MRAEFYLMSKWIHLVVVGEEIKISSEVQEGFMVNTVYAYQIDYIAYVKNSVHKIGTSISKLSS